MAGITVRGPLFNPSWTDDQSLIWCPRRFKVKSSLTRDLIWTALVQQKLRLNRGQGRIWTWFKLDRRWWNAPLVFILLFLLLTQTHSITFPCFYSWASSLFRTWGLPSNIYKSGLSCTMLAAWCYCDNVGQFCLSVVKELPTCYYCFKVNWH